MAAAHEKSEIRAPAAASAAPSSVTAPEMRASASPYGELFDPEYANAVDLMADARPLSLDSSLFQSDPMYKPEPEAPQTQVAEAEPAPAAPLERNARRTPPISACASAPSRRWFRSRRPARPISSPRASPRSRRTQRRRPSPA